MPDVLNGTEQPLSVDAAGSTLAAMLSAKPEDKQKREAPRPEAENTAEVDEVEEAEPEEVEASEPATTDEEEPEDDDVEPEPKTPEPRKIKVKIDGQESEVTEEEAAKGYSRTEDYTRKTQKLSEERKAFEAEATAVRGERQRYAQQLASLDQLLTESAGQEPDWDTLRNEDPATFAATYAAWDQHQKRIAAVRNERAKAEAKVRDDQANQLRAHLASEAEKLTAAIPEWKDPEKAKAGMTQVAAYARELGYTDEELGQVVDHRVFRILKDAAAFRAAEAKAPAIEKKIAEAKVLAPGSGEVKRPVSELTRRKMALAKTGTVEDAGAAIALML